MYTAKTTIQICMDLDDLTLLNEVRIETKQKNLSGAVIYLLRAYEQLIKLRTVANTAEKNESYQAVRTEQVQTDNSWRAKYGLPP